MYETICFLSRLSLVCLILKLLVFLSLLASLAGVLIQKFTTIMIMTQKERENVFAPQGFELWFPGTKSQCATNELH